MAVMMEKMADQNTGVATGKTAKTDADSSIQICLAFDKDYVPHAAVTILSAVQVLTENQQLVIHVLHSGDISNEDQQRLEDLSPVANLLWYEVDATRYDDLPDNRSHVSLATYLRLFIPEVLNGVTSRVIYLDCDTIIADELMPLWNTKLGGAPLAAAPDEGGKTQWRRLSLAEDAFYFNAGILLFNLDAIEPEEFASQVRSIATQPDIELELQDQDILNLIFAGRVHRLDLRWNANTRLFTPNLLEPAYDLDEAAAARKSPGIVHFTDSRKPWSGNCNHPMRMLYWDLRNQTPWRETTGQFIARRLEDTLRNWFSKSRREIRRAD